MSNGSGGIKIDKATANAIIRALVGGRNPSHGDVLTFIAEGGDGNLGYTFRQAVTVESPDPDVDPDEPGSGPSPSVPPANHVHTMYPVYNVHDTNALKARFAGHYNIWVGRATPINGETWDAWLKPPS